MYRRLGDNVGVATVLHNLGNLHCQQNNHMRARALYSECLTRYEQRESHADIALLSLGIGAVVRDQGKGEVASTAFARSLELAQALGDEWTAATALLNRGDIVCDRDELAAARNCFDAALASFERLGDQEQVAVAQARLALAAFLGSEHAAAVRLFRQSLMLASAIGFQPGVADGLEGLGGCAAYTQPLLAARLFAAAATLRKTLELPISLAELPRHAQLVRAAQCGSEPAAWAEGQQLASAQAVALALTHLS